MYDGLQGRMRISVIWFLLLLVCLLGVPDFAPAQARYLIESESPYVPQAWNIELIALADLESGAIPTALVKPQAGFSFFGYLHLTAAPIMAYFFEEGDYLLTGWEASLRFRLPPYSSNVFSLYGYGKVHHTFAEPYTVQYEGDLAEVHTVISPYTDTGVDFIGGISGVISFTIGPLGAGILFSGNYARTINRTYNPVFEEEEGYKNRIFLNGAPALFLELGKNRSFKITAAAQNRFTFWFERGFMYDLLPQVTFTFSPAFSVVVGGSLPMVGGGVYKLYVGTRIVINPERRVRIVVRDIHFPPDKAILFGPQNTKARKNMRTIDRLYRQLERYPGYAIIIEGHTSFVYWDDPVKGPEEQEQVLIPLSYARANAVLEALVERGIPRSRMTAVGKGGSEPLVPFSRKEEQWKNRRVEIHLQK